MSRALPDARHPLSEDDAETAFTHILDGLVSDEDLAAFLTVLADRGETIIEVTAAARALRARQSYSPQAPDAIDVCGTGGDGQHSLNVSTAVSLVVAACGVKVAKHGNRAASSASGAADVLSALGVPELQLDRLGPCLEAVGITFLHAARHHPAMARVAPVRRALGRRTIFNMLGPLANPAGVKRQLVGVFAPGALPLMAGALNALGSTRALVIHGDGFDELAVSGDSQTMLVADGRVSEAIIRPEDAGIARHPASAIEGGTPDYNATRMLALLGGQADAYRDIVVLNAAAALRVARPSLDLLSAAAEAAIAIDSGAAADTLARWKAFQ